MASPPAKGSRRLDVWGFLGILVFAGVLALMVLSNRTSSPDTAAAVASPARSPFVGAWVDPTDSRRGFSFTGSTYTCSDRSTGAIEEGNWTHKGDTLTLHPKDRPSCELRVRTRESGSPASLVSSGSDRETVYVPFQASD
jgi:hypothetical protein